MAKKRGAAEALDENEGEQFCNDMSWQYNGPESRPDKVYKANMPMRPTASDFWSQMAEDVKMHCMSDYGH
jgi:hypothetical protein